MKKLVMALCALLAITTTAFAVDATQIRIRGAAAKSGGLTEAQVRTQSNVSLVSVAEAGTITAPAFGFEIWATNGESRENGTWTLDSMTHTIRVNGSVALGTADGLPIANRQFGTFNAVGGATPDIRGLDADLTTQSVPNFTATSGGVTLNTTSSVILSGHSIPLTGTIRRPFLANPGDFYSIEYAINGSFNGTPFATRVTTMVVVGVSSIWADLDSNCNWRPDGSSWIQSVRIVQNGEDNHYEGGVKVSSEGVGKQIVILGWESSTDLGDVDPWAPWTTTFNGYSEDGLLIIRATNGLDGERRFFRLRHMAVSPPSES